MPPGERHRKTEHPKNYESPFDALEKDARYIGAVYLSREAGAQEPHTIALLQTLGFPIERKEAVAQRAHFVSGSRDGYHSFLRERYDHLPEDQRQEMRVIVDLFMRTEAPEKYWQKEPGARLIASLLLKANVPLPVISFALTHHLGGVVKSTTIREVIKLIGKDELLKRLSVGIETAIDTSDAPLIAETFTALATRARRESKRYRSEWNKNPRTRGLVLRLAEQGISPQGIALILRKRLRIQVPVVTLKYFLHTKPPFPTLDDAQMHWIDEKMSGAHEDYAETKQQHYRRGAALRYERTLHGEALSRYKDAQEKRVREHETALYKEHAPRLRRLAAALDSRRAHDLVQESFLKLFSHLRRNTLELWVNVDPYSLLATICRNLFRDTVRTKDHKLTTHNDELVAAFPSDSKSPDEIADEQRTAMLVRAAILKLPQELQMIAQYKYIDELSEQEISHILAIPLGTVKSRWRTAARLLRDDLKDLRVTED